MSNSRRLRIFRTVSVILVVAVIMVAVVSYFTGSRKPKPAAIWEEVCDVTLLDKLRIQEITQPVQRASRIMGADVEGGRVWSIKKNTLHSLSRKGLKTKANGMISDFSLSHRSYLNNGCFTVSFALPEWKESKLPPITNYGKYWIPVTTQPPSKLSQISGRKSSQVTHGIIDATKPRRIVENSDWINIDTRMGCAFDNPEAFYISECSIYGMLSVVKCSGNPRKLKNQKIMLKQHGYVVHPGVINAESINSLGDTLYIIGDVEDLNLAHSFAYRVSFYDLKNDEVTACFDFADLRTDKETIGINDLLYQASHKPSHIKDLYDEAQSVAAKKIAAIKQGTPQVTEAKKSYLIGRRYAFEQLAPSFGELPALFSLHATKGTVGSSKKDNTLYFLFSIDEKSLEIEDIETPVGTPYGDTTEMWIGDSAFDNETQRLFVSFSVFDRQAGRIYDARNKGKCQDSIWILGGDGEWSKLTDGATYSDLSVAPDGALWFIESSGYAPNAGYKKYAVIRVSSDLTEKKEVFTSPNIIHTLLVDQSE